MDEKMHKAFDELTAQMNANHERLLERLDALSEQLKGAIEDARSLNQLLMGTGQRLRDGLEQRLADLGKP
jgi:hypothetical protein